MNSTVYKKIKEQAQMHQAILIGVTKTRSAQAINLMIKGGIEHIGENRIVEAIEKFPHLETKVTKHFIGHIQSKKIKDIVKHFDVIHSVDRLKVAQKINEECQKINKKIPLLIQVNTSDEEQKGGLQPEAVQNFIKSVQSFPYIKIIGLMTMAMQSDHSEEIRGCFVKLRKCLETIKKDADISSEYIKELSMGMSNDYLIALQEGATMIRVGRKLFEN